MTLPEKIMEIKYLASQGVSKAQLARQFGVSRQTVYNLLARSSLTPRRRRVSKLDAFRGYIRARLEKFDLSASSLCREPKRCGYTGASVRDGIRNFF